MVELKENEQSFEIDMENGTKKEITLINGKGLGLGTSFQIWPSSLVLVQFLHSVSKEGLFKDKVVLELGGGAGLAGIGMT